MRRYREAQGIDLIHCPANEVESFSPSHCFACCIEQVLPVLQGDDKFFSTAQRPFPVRTECDCARVAIDDLLPQRHVVFLGPSICKEYPRHNDFSPAESLETCPEYFSLPDIGQKYAFLKYVRESLPKLAGHREPLSLRFLVQSDPGSDRGTGIDGALGTMSHGFRAGYDLPGQADR
jgi:hypothetical protein